ncbi:hypothetical protein [Pedobacter heparinus]|uniref:hypothetical protein n=1 Tax=Pedobacter heparinus TaxID=984 RepID=UPI00292F0E2E|nr:hypothetical protein [Pedobacter heparinus]
MIKELKIDSSIISYAYNENNEISIKTIIDTVSNSKEIYRYKRDKMALTISEDQGKAQVYNLDDNQRLISYSYNNGTVYEYNFKYDPRGRLKSAKRERFIKSSLFSTNYIKVVYHNDNPVAIIDSCVLERDYKENGSNNITRYFISYYADHELEYTNDAILSITAGYLHEFTYLGYKGSTGDLPNKLIKKITQKTDGEPSSHKDFSYKLDSKGNVIEMVVSFSDLYNKATREVVKLLYNCD